MLRCPRARVCYLCVKDSVTVPKRALKGLIINMIHLGLVTKKEQAVTKKENLVTKKLRLNAGCSGALGATARLSVDAYTARHRPR